MVEIDLEAVEDELRTREQPVATTAQLAESIDAERAPKWIGEAVRALDRSGAVGTEDVGEDVVVWHQSRVTPPLASSGGASAPAAGSGEQRRE